MEKSKSNKQLMLTDRYVIEENQKRSVDEIAQKLNRHRNTVLYEMQKGTCFIKENGEWKLGYDANIAEYIRNENKIKSNAKIKENDRYHHFFEKLEELFLNSDMNLVDCVKNIRRRFPDLEAPRTSNTIIKYIEKGIVNFTMEDVKNRKKEVENRKEQERKKKRESEKNKYNEFYSKLEEAFYSTNCNLFDCIKQTRLNYPQLKSPKRDGTIKIHIEKGELKFTMEDVKNRAFDIKKEKLLKNMMEKLKLERDSLQ